jgi:alpha(1,3/1,4) fucosyltransferase
MINIREIYKEVLKDTKSLRKYYEDYKLFKPYQVKLYNWFRFSPDEWLPRFIYERGINKHTHKEIAVFSVFGSRLNIKIDRSNFKIFFTGENVHARFIEYQDLMLSNKNIDLSVGFDYLEHDQYIRFPVWLMNLFEPQESSYKSIKQKCENWNKYDEIKEREKFCSFLSRHDYFGDRLFFYNEISSIGGVDSDGEFMHNNDDLKRKFNDDKFEYLRNYKFNLCPENSNYPGYCTEKVFEAITCGCVPIYWGTDNNPEPEVLNHNAIFFLKNQGSNDQTLNEILLLKENKKLYLEFARQKRFTDQAPDIIYAFFSRLEQKLITIAKNC